MATSSGAHQLLLSMLRPHDPRYAALALAGDAGLDATLPYVVLCWPIADPLARYRMAKERGLANLVKSHDAYWPDEAAMAEGSPQAILDRGEGSALPPALIVQGTKDDNVTPDMADRLAAAWRARGGEATLEKFADQPHTFIMRDPASEASDKATALIKQFVAVQAARLK
jgi:acetyl esterase/lipase